MKYFFIVFILVWAVCPANAQDITLGSLLEEMISRENLAKYPLIDYQTKQFSSYDRRAKQPEGEHWFANEDRTNFLGKEETKNGLEWVMFDTDKPGAIVRWWMTFAGEGAGDGILRIYIDGAKQPTIEGRALDLMSGGLLALPPLSVSVSPTTRYNRRGHNVYLPIPYKSCKITYQGEGIKVNEKGEIAKESVAIYYNINYREYSVGTSVESFSKQLLEKYLPEIHRAQIALLHPYTHIFNRAADKTIKLRTLQPGEHMDVGLNGEKYIQAFSMKLEAEYLSQALRSTVITMSFDDTETLTVPVGDFFGTGYEINPYQTYYTKVFDDGTLACFWPMPFKKEAQVSIINYGDQEVMVKDVQLFTNDWRWNNRSMYFGGTWKQFYNKQTGGGEDPEDLDFVTLKGKGVYVGDLIVLYNDAAAWWGEGDEKIYVDEEAFPSHFGTGTEDYYGYAWSRPEFYEHPFIAQPDGSGNLDRGTAVNIRFRALDKIPFRQHLNVDMELWHWTQTSIDYAPTTFFYLRPESEVVDEFKAEEVKHDVRFASRSEKVNPIMENQSIQGENMETYRIDGGDLLPRSFADWDWEGDTHLVWRNAAIGDVAVIRFWSREAMETAQVELQLTQSKNYGIVSISINSREQTTFDGYAPEIQVTQLTLDGIDIKEGWNNVKLELKGKNPNATSYVFGIDYLKVK